MQLISVHQGKLIKLTESAWTAARDTAGSTGLAAMDEILPAGLARGAVHELLLDDENYSPAFVAIQLPLLVLREGVGGEGRVRSCATRHRPSSLPHSQSTGRGSVIWSDPARTLYPPALFQNVNPQQLFILRPRDLQEELWALAECLRCRGVGAVIARLPARLHRNDVRRLQLAAERGGGIGVFLRPRSADIYAAATRWLVEPARGQRTIHRWKLTLLHGHGGQIGKSFILERCRENNSVRAVNELANRPGTAAAQQIRFA